MQNAFRRTAAGAPPIVPAATVNNNNDEDADSLSLESLDSLESLRSSKSMASLETLPPFSPPFKSPAAGGKQRRSWRKSARSSSGRVAVAAANNNNNDSSRSIGSDATGSIGNDVDSMTSATTGRSSIKPFRMPAAKLFSSSPKRLFQKGSVSVPPAPSSMPPTGNEEEKLNDQQVPATPSLPPSSISQRGNQLLSPLTPFATAVQKDETAIASERKHDASNNNNMTPRTSNNETTIAFLKNRELLEMPIGNLKHHDSKEEGKAENKEDIEPAEPPSPEKKDSTESNNDDEAQTVLDSLQHDFSDEPPPRLLDASDAFGSPKQLNISVNTSIDSKNDSGYAEFLNLISSSDSAAHADGDGAKKLRDESLTENDVEADLLEDVEKPVEENAAEFEEKPLDADVGGGVDGAKKLLYESLVENAVEEDLAKDTGKPMEDCAVEAADKEEHAVEVGDKPVDGNVMEDIHNSIDAVTVEEPVDWSEENKERADAPSEESGVQDTLPCESISQNQLLPKTKNMKADSSEEVVAKELPCERADEVWMDASEMAVAGDDEPSDFENDDCQCFWCPEPFLNLFRGVNANQAAFAPIPQEPAVHECSNGTDSNNNSNMQKSVESLRVQLRAMKEQHAHIISSMDKYSINLFLSEIHVIERSLDNISSLSSMNSMGGNKS